MSTDAASGTRVVGRPSFLASAGELLASSLDLEQTLANVARLAVPTLGDLCLVDIVEGEQLRRVATAHVRPEKIGLLGGLDRFNRDPRSSPQPAARVLRSGQSELLRETTPEIVAAHCHDAEHAALIRAIGIRSHLAVPMRARGHIVGVICIGISESERRYGGDDLAFAEDLARIAALAVDNARLFRLAQDELTERRRAEAELRLSEQRSRALIEQAPLSTQVLAADGTTIRVNRAWETLWGISADVLDRYNVLEDEQLELRGITPLLRRAFAGEPVALPVIPYDTERTLPKRSRNADPVRYVRAFAYPIKDDDGAVREVVLVHEDITAEHQAAEKLRREEQRLRLALDAGRMNVWEWTLDSDLVECSPNADDFWSRCIGHADDFLSLVMPDDLPRIAEAVRMAVDEDAQYLCEYRLREDDGGTRWVQSRGRVERDADGRVCRLLGVTLDITERKLGEEATRLLADAGKMLGMSLDHRATLDSLARLVVPRFADWCTIDLLDEAGELERVAVQHVDPERIALGHEVFDRYRPRRSAPRGIWNVIRTCTAEHDQVDQALLEAVAHDAEHVRLLRAMQLKSYICVPLIARGKAIGALTLVDAESGRRFRPQDIELAGELARRAASAIDNARLHDALRAEQQRKDEFIATLAHELRNPLAPLRSGLALLDASTDPQLQQRSRQIMQRQLGHMVRLVDDLLDVSRITRGTIALDRQAIDIAEVVASAVETSRPLIEQAQLTLTVTLPEQRCLVFADRTRMSQVLSNLLNNAARFTDAGGQVELVVEAGDGEVAIRVSDNGAGIDAGALTRIFEMFAQGHDPARRHGGLGIGLTLVRRLVDLHGGRVWAESAGVGCGSRFNVQLPRLAADASAAAKPAPAVEPAAAEPRGQRVLVVDDNHDAADMLASLLAIDGHRVRVAYSGQQALESVEQFLPDVAFLDIGLPDLDGYRLARELRARLGAATPRLVALTGWGQERDRQQSRDAGFDLHLTKPVDHRQLTDVLR